VLRQLQIIFASVAAYMVALAVVSVVAVLFFNRLPDAVVVPLEYLIPVAPAVAMYRSARRGVDRERQVARTDGGICSACGYDLTGNVSGVCPECGKEMLAR
jgi:hypothetical protein